MYKIIKNIIPDEKMVQCQNYIIVNSKNYRIEEGTDSKGKYQIKRIFNDELLNSQIIKDIFFYEPLIKKIKSEIGPFTILNYFSGMINSFGTSTHRDGQSYGFNYESKNKSKKIFKVMFYFDVSDKRISKCLDVNIFDFELKNFFFNKKIYMKINSLYENYLRKNLMKSLRFNLGDVIIMDNNTWHRASFIENRENLMSSNFKCKKILLSFEIVNDEKVIKEHAKHVRNHYAKNKNGEFVEITRELIENKYLEILKKNNINIFHI
jgi:hypothetical protein